jgi:small Trp-rich protein
MWLVWVGVTLLALRLLGVGPFVEMSRWWIAAPFLLALFWFEIVEARFGFSKKKAMDEMAKAKERRIKQAFEQGEAGRRFRRRF